MTLERVRSKMYLWRTIRIYIYTFSWRAMANSRNWSMSQCQAARAIASFFSIALQTMVQLTGITKVVMYFLMSVTFFYFQRNIFFDGLNVVFDRLSVFVA